MSVKSFLNVYKDTLSQFIRDHHNAQKRAIAEVVLTNSSHLPPAGRGTEKSQRTLAAEDT